jgi:hypothetical protein
VIVMKVDAYDGWTAQGHTWWEVGTPEVSDKRKGPRGPCRLGSARAPDKGHLMKRFTPDTAEPAAIVEELLNGGGAVLLSRGCSPRSDRRGARGSSWRTPRPADKVTHFQGAAEAEGALIACSGGCGTCSPRARCFRRWRRIPVLMAALRVPRLEFIMGSIAANRILPGGPGQEPHVDYPYWDFHAPHTHPVGLNGELPDERAGLGDPRPVHQGKRGHRLCAWVAARAALPPTESRSSSSAASGWGEPGDAALFYGAVWHCAMPNKARTTTATPC